MSHDRIKAATRERMAKTGEPYVLAHRAIIREHKEARRDESASDATRGRAFSMVADQLAKLGQETRSRLISAPGVDEIQRRFAALHEFRNLGHSVDDQPAEITELGRPRWQCRRCGSDLELDSTGGWASSGGTGRCPHEGASW